MAKGQSAIAEISSLIPERVGVRPWWDRVTPEVAEVLPSVLQAWRNGDFGRRRRTAARAIAAWLRKHGVDIREQGVENWLRRNAK